MSDTDGLSGNDGFFCFHIDECGLRLARAIPRELGRLAKIRDYALTARACDLPRSIECTAVAAP